MSNGAKLEEAERIARRGTSLLTFMIIKKRIEASIQAQLGPSGWSTTTGGRRSSIGLLCETALINPQ